MVRFVYTKKGIKFEEQWFADEPVLPPFKKTDFLNVHGIKRDVDSIDARFGKIQHSLITDLNENVEELYSKIGKSTKYKIRRAEKDGTTFNVFIGSQIDRNLRELFGLTFSKMYEEKGSKVRFNYEMADECIRNESIAYTVGYLDDQPLVFHSYLFDSDNTRLYQSCSLFRGMDEKEKKNQIGYVNRALHWYDIQHFKEMGIKKYDWGGVSSLKTPDGIAQFKIDFGGTPVEYYNYSIPVSLIGKAYYFVKNH